MQIASTEQLVQIPADHISLEGMLELPENPQGIVLFAHGSGSSRLSPRNNFVARILREAGHGTLLIDLLTPDEDVNYENRFDISLLTRRLLAATHWLRHDPRTKALPIGYFGASTGAAAALDAEAAIGGQISAIVSRGGRPDLAGPEPLMQVRCPTMLIVGGLDNEVIELNQQSYALISCEKELVIIPGATHLFEEPGTLEQVAKHAARWFSRYLKPA